MCAALGWLATLDWNAILQIILIDILLGGDNAVIIALACRNLPARQRRAGIIWGAAGAIVLRVILITVAVALLQVPFLKLIGGVLLLWIGIKLIAPADEGHGHGKLEGSDKLLAAIKTIIKTGFDPVYGARPLKRTIQHMIQDPLAVKILDGSIKDGDPVTVDLEKGQVVFRSK